MSLGTSELSAADIAAVTRNNNNGNCGGYGMGGDWLIALIILFLFPMMFGGGMWGGGMFGGMGGWGNGGLVAAANGALTRADLCSEFNFNGLESSVRAVQQGLCDGFYAVNTSLLNGFHGVDNAVCQLGYQTQQGFNGTNIALMQAQNALQAQISDCCCKNQTGQLQLGNQVERGFCDVNYAQATNTTAIIQNAHNDTDRILARIDAFERNQDKEKIAQQAAEIQAYKQNAAFGAMIDASRAEILRRTGAECPTAAYIVQPPQPVSFNTNCNGQATFGNNCNGCNSGCGCAYNG